MKLSSIVSFSLLVLLVFVSACTTTSSGDSVQRTPAAAVDMYREPAKPERPYKELKLLVDEGVIGEQLDIEGKFLDQAKKLGGNAIIMHTPVRRGIGTDPSFRSSLNDIYLFRASVLAYE